MFFFFIGFVKLVIKSAEMAKANENKKLCVSEMRSVLVNEISSPVCVCVCV